MRAISAVAILACWGCGGGSSPTLSLHTSLEAALDCGNRDALVNQMEATLDISGHAPCEGLQVTDRLEVYGDCEVTIGSVRYLGLAYEWQGMTLAYVIGWVDLTKEALAENATNVDVDLRDRTRSAQVSSNAERDGLPTGTCGTKDLCDAEAWAKDLLVGKATSFDHSAGVSNLAYACNPL